MQRKVAAALVAVLALGLASCGGTSRLSAADFRKQANSVCSDTRAMLLALEQQASGVPRSRGTPLLVATMNTGLEQLGRLHAPSELDGGFERLRKDLAAQRDFFAQAAHRTHPTAAARRANVVLTHRIGRTANELGLPGCV
jgi:hypothetical protein